MSPAACLRVHVGGLALMASACAAPRVPDAGLSACGDRLARNATCMPQHIEAREGRKMVIRFASEAAMNAQDEATETLTLLRTDLLASRNLTGGERGLPGVTAAHTNNQTTGEEAGTRIAEAKVCAQRYPG